MFYNMEKQRVQQMVDCIGCEYYDKELKKCNGFGKNCFEYDRKTKTIIEPKTGLPLKINKGE